MTKPQILILKDKRDLRKISSKFSELVGQSQIGQTLILVDTGKVLTSRDVEKILNKARLKDGLSLSFVTTNVTVEAGQLLRERNIYLLQTRDFFWTDYDYSQRQEDTHRFIDRLKQQLHDKSVSDMEDGDGSSAQHKL